MTYNVFGGTLNLTQPTNQPQGISAIWLVLIAPTHEGMARLSKVKVKVNVDLYSASSWTHL